MAYSKRIFNHSNLDSKKLTLEDLENGYKTFLENKDNLKDKKDDYQPPAGMYI